MSNASQFDPVIGAPLAETRYTSGTGTHTPLPGTKWLEVTLQAPGGGGGRGPGGGVLSPAGGGGAGEFVMCTIPANGPMAYAVGVPGVGTAVANAAGASGGNVTLGHLVAFGGRGGLGSTTDGIKGGEGGGMTATPTQTTRPGTVPGGAGGGAMISSIVVNSHGRAAGLPVPLTAVLGDLAGGGASTGYGCGGGSSVLGGGGAGPATSTGNGAAGNGYGGGGAGSGSGTSGDGAPGILIVREFAS